MNVWWLKGAIRSLRGVHTHLATENSQAARHVVHGVREATKRLALFSGSGRPGKLAGTRELVIARWPYIVVYRVAGDQVQILRVFHTATDWWNTPTAAAGDENL